MGRSYNNGGSVQPFEGQEILSAFICPTLQGNANNYFINNRGFVNASALYVSAISPVNITGLVGAIPNRELLLFNLGSNAITLKDASGSSATANQFLLGADLILNENQSVKLIGVPTGGWASQGGTGGGGGSTAAGALVTLSTTQNIPNATFTAVSFDTVQFDVSAIPLYSGANPTRLTAPSDGLYIATMSLKWGDTQGSYDACEFRVNGASPFAYSSNYGNIGIVGNSLSVILNLLATDYVEAMAFQAGGGTLTLGRSDTGTSFGLAKIG